MGTIGVTERLVSELADLSAKRHRLAREEAIIREALRHSRMGRTVQVIAAHLAEQGVDPARVLGIEGS